MQCHWWIKFKFDILELVLGENLGGGKESRIHSCEVWSVAREVLGSDCSLGVAELFGQVDNLREVGEIVGCVLCGRRHRGEFIVEDRL